MPSKIYGRQMQIRNAAEAVSVQSRFQSRGSSRPRTCMDATSSALGPTLTSWTSCSRAKPPPSAVVARRTVGFLFGEELLCRARVLALAERRGSSAHWQAGSPRAGLSFSASYLAERNGTIIEFPRGGHITHRVCDLAKEEHFRFKKGPLKAKRSKVHRPLKGNCKELIWFGSYPYLISTASVRAR
jgi:hypothetical protein